MKFENNDMNKHSIFARGAIFGVLLLLFQFPAIAQEYDIGKNLSLAKNMYKRGQIDSTLALLKPALDSRKIMSEAGKSTKAEVYRLAAHCNILLEKSDVAREQIKEMLSYHPNYKHESSGNDDLMRFRSVVDSLNVLPRLLFSARAGSNTTSVSVSEQYSLFEMDNPQNGKYLNGYLGYSFALGVELFFGSHFSLLFEPGYTNQQFKYEAVYDLDLFPLSYTENVTCVDFPLLARMSFLPYKKYRPFVEVGGNYRMLLTAERTLQGQSLPVNSVISSYDVGAILGGGLIWRQKNYNLELGLRYIHNFTKYNNPDNRYLSDTQSDVFVYWLYYLSDDISLNNIQLAIRFSYNITYKVFD